MLQAGWPTVCVLTYPIVFETDSGHKVETAASSCIDVDNSLILILHGLNQAYRIDAPPVNPVLAWWVLDCLGMLIVVKEEDVFNVITTCNDRCFAENLVHQSSFALPMNAMLEARDNRPQVAQLDQVLRVMAAAEVPIYWAGLEEDVGLGRAPYTSFMSSRPGFLEPALYAKLQQRKLRHRHRVHEAWNELSDLLDRQITLVDLFLDRSLESILRVGLHLKEHDHREVVTAAVLMLQCELDRYEHTVHLNQLIISALRRVDCPVTNNSQTTASAEMLWRGAGSCYGTV